MSAQGEILNKLKNYLYLRKTQKLKINLIVSIEINGDKKTEAYLEPTIPDKIFGTKQRNPVTQDKARKVVSTFACFLAAIAKDYFLERRMSGRLSLHPNLRFF